MIGASLLVMLCNFLVNGHHTALRLVAYLDISGNAGTACLDGDVLTLFDNVHELIVIVALNRRLKRPDIITEPCAFDVRDDLVNDANDLFVPLNGGENLNGYACLHKNYLLIKNSLRTTPRENGLWTQCYLSQFNSYGGIIRIRFEGSALRDLSRRTASTP